jgi:hypothetical protein
MIAIERAQYIYQLPFKGNLYSNVAKAEWKEIYRIVAVRKPCVWHIQWLSVSQPGAICFASIRVSITCQ